MNEGTQLGQESEFWQWSKGWGACGAAVVGGQRVGLERGW